MNGKNASGGQSNNKSQNITVSASATIVNGAMEFRATVPLPPSQVAERIEAAKRGVTYGEHYEWVQWGETRFEFTPKQRVIVKLLFGAWRDGERDVRQDALLDAADSDSQRLRDVFRGHPAWGVMVTQGASGGLYRVVMPDEA
jgi:hypothetical protein